MNKRGAPEFTDHDERMVEQLAVRVGTIIETATLYQAEGLERAWLKSVIDQMPDGVLLNDINGVTRAENRMLQEFASTTNQVDPWGQPVRYDLRLPNDQPVSIDDQPHIRAIIDGKTTPPTEFALYHSDGRRVPMLVSASPVFDVYGHRSGAVTIYQDISAIKELQRLRDEWTSIVAHDLRQPVNVIAMDASMLDARLQRGQLDECRRSAVRIQRSATQLDAMIHDLLDASVIDAGRLTLNRKPTELIFDRFVRSESTRGSRVEGLGLGLYISRGIVEAHGGRMWAESTAADTTSFHLTIPVIVTASSDGSLPTVTLHKGRTA